jgi:lipopolysaccharide export system protein LptA
LRNREAARYARWAAITAGLIALAVAGVYAERALRRARAVRGAPAAVSIAVQQQSAQFSFSKVEQNRTIFTVRASRATQYKEQNRSVLEDVWITLYGRDGSRNDNIHTRECSYEGSGDVSCEGDVELDLANANPAPGQPVARLAGKLEVKTSNLSFNRNTGEASTPAPVEFRFPAGQGHGVGVTYSTANSIVRVDHAVEFDLPASDHTGGMPVTATGSSLEVRRADRHVVLAGPALVRQGARELSADTLSVELDADYHARRLVATGHPQIHTAEGGGKIAISAVQLGAVLNPAGWVEHVSADGNVDGTRQTASGTDRFSASHVEFVMIPEKNLIQDMTASGGVTAESHSGGDSRVLKTGALRVTFSSPTAAPHSGPATGKTDQQRVESAETLAPATIESTSKSTAGSELTALRAKKFVAQLGPGGHLDKLLGHAGVEVRRQIGDTAPQTLSSAELIATFGAHGDWDTLDERGNVRFQQADRQATADHATIVRTTDMIVLDGSPVISDAMSRTTAANVVVNQKSGELSATGGVVSTYVPTAQGNALSLGSGNAHVSADSLSGNVGSTHAMVTYTGHARLWQGESVLDSDQIKLWQGDKKLQANGHVVAVFSQVSSPFAAAPEKRPGSTSAPRTGSNLATDSAPASATTSGNTLWRVLAPTLTYWSDQGKAHLEGGVSASSDQGSLESPTLDIFLDPAAPAPGNGSSSAAAAKPSPASTGVAGGRQLERAVAQGGVVVRQEDRRATAEQAIYTAADGKFVLSGGEPTIADASSNTTKGRSLTFFVASDTILIDSQEGSRTLTKHRVEK